MPAADEYVPIKVTKETRDILHGAKRALEEYLDPAPTMSEIAHEIVRLHIKDYCLAKVSARINGRR